MASNDKSAHRRNRPPQCSVSSVVMVVVLFIVVTIFNLVSRTSTTPIPNRHLALIPSWSTLPARSSQLWGQYSPYFAVEQYRSPPPGCVISQVNIIERHGARFPTASAGARINATVQKIKAASSFADPKLRFLQTYTYDLGINDLVPFGALQSYESGHRAFVRYHALVSKPKLPFVRASSSTRVVDSSTNWTAGFVEASGHRFPIAPPLILSEALNDTLDDNMCPNAGSSDAADAAWQATFAPPITARLNKGAPGANLTDSDVTNLLQLCAFDSVAHEHASPFCNIFSESEFQLFEYSGDVDKFYNTGYGQPLGPVQGVGYINELISRLTGKPVSDETQTNRTLDSSPKTFPLDRPLYADFSHDNQMIAIYASLGLFKQPLPLSLTSPDPRRTWLASHLVPFSAQLVTEKLTCGEHEFVRMLVSDAVQPLEFCGKGDGLCTVDAFVKSQGYARENGRGDFQKCFL